MSTPYDAIPQQVADERIERFNAGAAVGWTDFAALMMGIVGAWNILSGILALRDSNVYDENAHFVFSNLHTWGWVTLVLGVLQFFAAFSLWSGGLYGRIVGITAAGLSAIAALLSIPAYPFWSLAIFALDIVIIHQIATRGTEGRRA